MSDINDIFEPRPVAYVPEDKHPNDARTPVTEIMCDFDAEMDIVEEMWEIGSELCEFGESERYCPMPSAPSGRYLPPILMSEYDDLTYEPEYIDGRDSKFVPDFVINEYDMYTTPSFNARPVSPCTIPRHLLKEFNIPGPLSFEHAYKRYRSMHK